MPDSSFPLSCPILAQELQNKEATDFELDQECLWPAPLSLSIFGICRRRM